MKKTALSIMLVCIFFLTGCVPLYMAYKTDELNKPDLPQLKIEIETEETKKPVVQKFDAKAVDFVGKTADEVFEVLGDSYEIVGTESGAMQFVCESCPDLLFCVVPINWDGVNGVEKIEYIAPFNGAKANEFLRANMTQTEIEEALLAMPDVQFSNFESYYTEMDEMNVNQYLIQTEDIEFIYEWYEKDSNEPADNLVVYEKKVFFNEEEEEKTFEEIPTEIVEFIEA